MFESSPFTWLSKNIFVLAIVSVFMVLTFLLFHFEKGAILLLINENTTPFLNTFFKVLTKCAEWIIIVPIGLILLWHSFRRAIGFIIAFLGTGLVAQFLKKGIFHEMKRPIAFFEEGILNIIPGVDIHCCLSFPSGHTAVAFGVGIFLALLTKINGMKYVLLALCIGVGISRIYLLQHFFIDVYAGALLGTLCAFIAHHVSEKTMLVKYNWSGMGLKNVLRKQRIPATA